MGTITKSDLKKLIKENILKEFFGLPEKPSPKPILPKGFERLKVGKIYKRKNEKGMEVAPVEIKAINDDGSVEFTYNYINASIPEHLSAVDFMTILKSGGQMPEKSINSTKSKIVSNLADYAVRHIQLTMNEYPFNNFEITDIDRLKKGIEHSLETFIKNKI